MCVMQLVLGIVEGTQRLEAKHDKNTEGYSYMLYVGWSGSRSSWLRQCPHTHCAVCASTVNTYLIQRN